nr:hypothetical protein [uncultured Draconibacterium sp.]
MRIIFILLLGIVISSPLFSQDSVKIKTNLLGVQTGYGNYRYSDPLESANVYEGSYLPLNFQWKTFSPKHFDEISFSYSNISLQRANAKDVNLTDFKARCFNVSYAYHRTVFNSKKYQLYAGAKINGHFVLKDLKYTFIPPESSIQYYKNNDMFEAIDISMASKINLGENLLLVDLNGSLLSFVANRRYILDSNSENALLFFSHFKSFGFKTNYFHKITSDLYLNLGYQFMYYSYPRSKQVLITKGGQSQLLVGINLKF